MTAGDRERRPATWAGIRTIGVCFLAQNLGAGLAFGSFGPMLASNEAHFDVSRTVAASGMSIVLLAIGLLSPVAGTLLQTVSVRAAMLVGSIASAVGYALLAVAPSFGLAILAYALIGTGVSLIAILGPLTLVNRWQGANRGKVLALVNLPLAMLVGPYVIAEWLPVVDRAGILWSICAIFVGLTPLMLLVVEQPPGATEAASIVKAKTKHSSSALLSLPSFWLVSIGLGVISGAITVFLVHIVPFGVARGMSLPVASALISTYAGAGLAGILIFGWISDRIGPVKTLMLSAGLQAALWSALLFVEGNLIFAVAALIGVSAAPQPTLHGAAMGSLFGAQAVRAMGLSFAIKLPFLFGAGPASAAMFEHSSGYQLPFLVCAAVLAGATMLFAALLWTGRARNGVLTGAPV